MQFVFVVCAIFQSVMISTTSATNIPDHRSPGAARIYGDHNLNPSGPLKRSNVFGGIWKKYQSALSQQHGTLDKECHTHVLKDCNTEARLLETLAAGDEVQNPSGLTEVQVKESTGAQKLPTKGSLRRSRTSSYRSKYTHAELPRIIPDNVAINAQKHLLVGK